MKNITTTAIVLKSHTGPNYFEHVRREFLITPEDVVIKNICFSIDPVMRFWVTGVRTYFGKIKVGDVFHCFGIGQIIQGNKDYEVGAYIYGNLGTASFSILSERAKTESFIVDRDLIAKFGFEGFVYLITNGMAAFCGI